MTQRYALDGWNPAKGNPVGNEHWDVWADLDAGSSLITRYLRGDVVDELFGRESRLADQRSLSRGRSNRLAAPCSA